MSRASVSSEAQASELRGRARRRLVGALVLVIAAIIVVPLLLDTQPTGDEASAPLVVPAMVPPVAEPGATTPSAASGDVIATAPADEVPLPTPDTVVPDAADGAATTKSPGVAAAPHIESAPGPRAGSAPESKTPAKAAPEIDRKADEKPAASKRESKASPVERTDDGSVALALLEGRRPGRTAATKEPVQHGSYILQIAAYSTEKDAQSRRERLVSSGVTNAYVQDAISGGKTTYRLRVGPFPTHEAAQAAQARLRALGYDNSFISTK